MKIIDASLDSDKRKEVMSYCMMRKINRRTSQLASDSYNPLKSCNDSARFLCRTSRQKGLNNKLFIVCSHVCVQGARPKLHPFLCDQIVTKTNTLFLLL